MNTDRDKTKSCLTNPQIATKNKTKSLISPHRRWDNNEMFKMSFDYSKKKAKRGKWYQKEKQMVKIQNKKQNVIFKLTISIITLNGNHLNLSIKRQRLLDWIKIPDSVICCLQVILFKHNCTEGLKVKRHSNKINSTFEKIIK